MLLCDGAKLAEKVIEEFEPKFSSKDEFLNYVDGLNSCGERITYNEDGSAYIKI